MLLLPLLLLLSLHLVRFVHFVHSIFDAFGCVVVDLNVNGKSQQSTAHRSSIHTQKKIDLIGAFSNLFVLFCVCACWFCLSFVDGTFGKLVPTTFRPIQFHSHKHIVCFYLLFISKRRKKKRVFVVDVESDVAVLNLDWVFIHTSKILNSKYCNNDNNTAEHVWALRHSLSLRYALTDVLVFHCLQFPAFYLYIKWIYIQLVLFRSSFLVSIYLPLRRSFAYICSLECLLKNNSIHLFLWEMIFS